MQGVEGQIFNPMARTYAYALIGALIGTFTVTPCGARPQQGSGGAEMRPRRVARSPMPCAGPASPPTRMGPPP